MTKTKSTKRALLMSALALVMCFSMLIGSTFAWFTDSATSGNNKIVAGTLDVDLLMGTAADTYTSIADKDAAIFGANSLVAQNNPADTLWEPGKTQIVYLAVANKGNLDLKYNIALNVVDGGLIGSLEYAIVDDAQYGALDTYTDWAALKANALTGDVVAGTTVAAPNGAIKADEDMEYFALAVHMKEEADNQYQGKDITIDVTVLATQLASESDSFNNQYDVSAEYPEIITSDNAQAAINAAEKDDTLNLLNGTYGNLVIDYSEAAITEGNGQGSAPYKTVRDLGNFTVAGSGNGTVVNKLGFNSYHLTYFEGRGASMEGNENGAHVSTDSGYKFDTLTIKDLTLKGQFATSDARVTAEKIVFENVTFDCAGWVHLSPANNNIGEVVFENCKFVNGGSAEQGVHLVAYNQNITTEYTFEGCTFEGAKRQIMVTSHDGGKQCGTITITGCTFKNTAGERAIRMANILNGTVNVTNNTFENAADDEGEIMRIGYVSSTVTFTGNTNHGEEPSYTNDGSAAFAK